MTAVVLLAVAFGVSTWIWNSRDPGDLAGFIAAGFFFLGILAAFAVLATAVGWALG